MEARPGDGEIPRAVGDSVNGKAAVAVVVNMTVNAHGLVTGSRRPSSPQSGLRRRGS